MAAVAVFCPDHIHVGLKNRDRMIFITGRPRLLDYHVSDVILSPRKPVGSGKPHKIIAVLLFMKGAVGNSRHLFKIFFDRHFGV